MLEERSGYCSILLSGDVEENPGPCRKCNNNNCIFNGGKSKCQFPKFHHPKKSHNRTKQSKKANAINKSLMEYVAKESGRKDADKEYVQEKYEHYEEHKEHLAEDTVDLEKDLKEFDVDDLILTVEGNFNKIKGKKFYFYEHGEGKLVNTVLTINKDSIIKTLKHLLKGNLLSGLFDYIPYVMLRGVLLTVTKLIIKYIIPRIDKGVNFSMFIYCALFSLRKMLLVYDSYHYRPKGYLTFDSLKYAITEDYRWSAYDNYKLKHNLLFTSKVQIVRLDNYWCVDSSKVDTKFINYERFLEMVGPGLVDPHLTMQQIIEKTRIQNKIVQSTNQNKYLLDYKLADTMIVAEYFCLSNKQNNFDHLDFLQGDRQN
jgi:hypothetical protein